MKHDITYFPELCDLASLMLEAGALPEDIIKVWNIDAETFQGWRDQHQEFDEAIKIGMEFCEAWWMTEMQNNLSNPSYDMDRACDVMVKYFGWEDVREK